MTSRLLAAALATGLLGACATAPTPAPLLLPCPAALDIPTPPPRSLTTPPDVGAVVRAARLNRAAWIAHADELTARLSSCKTP